MGLDLSIRKKIEKAWARIRRRDLVELTRSLVEISSPTGDEGACAKFLVEYMKDSSLKSTYQEIDESRGNAIGILKGAGLGPKLLFNGHLDTSFTGIEEEDFPATGPLHPYSLAKAKVDGQRIYGLGVYNMKGGVAASVIAARAIAEAGIALRGDILVTAVAGEVEETPVNGLIRKYEGRRYRGASIGTEWLVKHGVVADFVINGEPTDLRVNWENGGYCWFNVQTRGKATYVIRKPYGVNAILEMVKVIQAIEEWAPRYTEAHASELTKPQVMVGAIESGWPYKPSTCPAVCNLYVDVRLAPGQAPGEAIQEFGRVLSELKKREKGLQLEWEPYLMASGERTDPASPYVRSCIRAYEEVMGKRHEPCLSEQASAWTDCNVFRRLGIPAVSSGPGAGASSKGKKGERDLQFAAGESQRMDDLELAAKIYVAAAVDICLK